MAEPGEELTREEMDSVMDEVGTGALMLAMGAHLLNEDTTYALHGNMLIGFGRLIDGAPAQLIIANGAIVYAVSITEVAAEDVASITDFMQSERNPRAHP